MTFSKNKIAKGLIFSFNSILFLFLLNLTTTFNNNVVIDASISQFVKEHINNSNRFLHSSLSRVETEDLINYNQKSLRAQASIKSDLTSYTSYITFEKNGDEDFDLYSPEFEFRQQAKILYLPFRIDVNRTYLESIRLRQFRPSADSRYIESGFDFSFYISSLMADQIILASEGTITSYDQILDHNGRGIDFNVEINGIIRKGHIRNIFYIESTNNISLSLEYYLGNFIIFYGNKDSIFQGYDNKFNYDFLSTNISIENNLLTLNKINFGKLEVFYDQSKISSNELVSLLPLMNRKYQFTPMESFITIAIILLIQLKIYRFFVFDNAHFSKYHTQNVFTFFLVLIIYQLLIKLLSFFKATSYLFFLLSNYVFGLLSIFFIFLILAHFFVSRHKISKYLFKRDYKNENHN